MNKKPFDMPSAESFRAMYPPQNEAFDNAICGTLSMLEDEQEVPEMKKKLSVSLAMAIVLMLALACTAVAASLGVFGEIAGSMMGEQLLRTLDEKSLAKEQTTVVPADGPFAEVTYTISQTYYDGKNLYISYEATGLGETQCAWKPTADEFAQMEAVGIEGLTEVEEDGLNGVWLEPAFVSRMVETAKREGSAGMMVCSSYLGDGMTLHGTDTYLELSMSFHEELEDGRQIGMREFATPLPEAAQNQDALQVDMMLYRAPTYHYYDGKTWYILWGERAKTALSATVPRNEKSAMLVRTAQREFDTHLLRATATVSPLKICVELERTSLPGDAQMTEEMWMDIDVRMDGEKLELLSGMGGRLKDGVCRTTLEFTRPKELGSALTLTPVYVSEEHEQKNDGETIAIELAMP